MNESWWVQVLATLLAQAPILLVLAAGVVLILGNTPPGKLRVLGSAGLVIALGSQLLGSVVMTLLPRLMLEWWAFNYNIVTSMILGARFVFNLVEALGYGLLLLAMLQALRQLRDGSSTAAR